MTRTVRAIAAIAASAALLWFLVQKIDLREAYEALRKGSPLWLIAAFVGSLGAVLSRGARYSLLLPECPPLVASAVIGIQTIFNRILPFRLGEASLPILLRAHVRVGLARSGARLLLVRLIELGVIVSILSLAAVSIGAYATAGAGAAVTLLVGVACWKLDRFVAFGLAILRRIAGALGRKGILGRLVVLEESSTGLTEIPGATRWHAALWTLPVVASQMAVFWFIILMVGGSVGPGTLVFGSCVAFVGPILPLPSVGSFGTLEASWVIGFVSAGVAVEDAIISGLAVQVVTLAIATLIAGLSWLVLRRAALRTPDEEGTEP